MKNKRFLKFISSPIFFGVILGIIVVLAQPLFKIQPPQAYGICTICHARDLLNWILKSIASIEFESAIVAANYPLLTTLGIILGSFISSKSNKEFRFIRSENYLKMFFLGIGVSIFGLPIISCPTRLFLRFSFSDPYAFLAIIGLFFGIFIGVIIIKKGKI